MIWFENLSKTFVVGDVRKRVADRINAVFPTGTSVALLGRNGAGKSSLLRIIAGTMDPTAGRVSSDGTISWPVGFAGSFHPDLTGVQNVRFLARVYGVDTDALVDFVAEISELGDYMQLPFRTYSAGMRSRLGFGASMGIHFDTYLVDEITAVGDADFKAKSQEILRERLRESSAVIVSHALGVVRRLCQAGAVLEDGHLAYYDDVEEAIDHHQRNMSGSLVASH